MMKKTAVLLYPQFCNFEISVALEVLALANKPLTFFAKDAAPVRSEEGLLVLADEPFGSLNSEEYDSLLLPGAADIREAVEDTDTLAFIRKFNRADMVIGAISIAPVLLLKVGMLNGKHFMAGVTRPDLLEEGFSSEDLKNMIGWDEFMKHPVPEGYIRDGTILTSVCSQFIRWAVAFAKAVGIDAHLSSFGIVE